MKDKYAVLLIVASLISSCSGSAAFVSGPRGHLHGAFRPTTKPSLYSPISMRGCSNSDKEIQIDDDAPDQSEDSLSLIKQLNLRADEILIEKERQRLEEANTQSFLKRHPWKLPYEEARRWVQANLAADTEEEFYQLVSVGCIDTPVRFCVAA